MGPNQNLNQPVQAPAQPSMEEQMSAALGEQPMQPVQPMMEEPKKKSNLAIILVIVLLVLAIAGGAAFGFVTIMNKDKEIAALNDTIKQLREANSELMGNDVDTEDYIYVGEWNLKIKIPEGLKKVSYSFKQHGPNQTKGSSLMVSGTVGEGLPDYANLYINGSSLGAVSRIPKDVYSSDEYSEMPDEIKQCGFDAEFVLSDDEYNYCYSHPQSVYSTDSSELELGSVEKIKEMLNNKENYSAI